jgi:hypothetical protein
MSVPELKVNIKNKTTDDDRIVVAVEKSNAKGLDVYTHNWCDKTTWYQDSKRVENEAAIDTGDHIKFALDNAHIIDVYHGKITQEDFLVDASGSSYRLSLSINGSGMVERDPHYGSGGDYTVNYKDGEVNLTSPTVSGADVRATYYYAQSSKFEVRPEPGTCLSIELAEVQFSTDVEITDTVNFRTYGYAGIFAPHLVGPSGLSFSDHINIKTFTYKTRHDYHNAAFKSYPTSPASTSPSATGNWRELTAPIIVYDWDYQRALPLNDTYGMYTVLELEHDKEFGGTYATATLYCGESVIES